HNAIVRVDPDEWTVLHDSHPFLEMDPAKSVRDPSSAASRVRERPRSRVTNRGVRGRKFPGATRRSRTEDPSPGEWPSTDLPRDSSIPEEQPIPPFCQGCMAR